MSGVNGHLVFGLSSICKWVHTYWNTSAAFKDKFNSCSTASKENTIHLPNQQHALKDWTPHKMTFIGIPHPEIVPVLLSVYSNCEPIHPCPYRSTAQTFIFNVYNRICPIAVDFCVTVQLDFVCTQLFIFSRQNRRTSSHPCTLLFCRTKVIIPTDYLILLR